MKLHQGETSALANWVSIRERHFVYVLAQEFIRQRSFRFLFGLPHPPNFALPQSFDVHARGAIVLNTNCPPESRSPGRVQFAGLAGAKFEYLQFGSPSESFPTPLALFSWDGAGYLQQRTTGGHRY